MSGLVSPAQLGFLRKFAELGMVQDIEIWPKTNSDSPYSDKEETTFAYRETVKGWIHQVPGGTIDPVSGVMAILSVFRVFFPIGTVIDSGDKIRYQNAFYIVQDTNIDNAYRVLMRCSLNQAG